MRNRNGTKMNGMKALRSFAIAVVAFVVLAAPAVVLADGRVALVVGNSTYAHIGRLPNAENDARDMSAALRRLGFEVTTELDADRVALSDTRRSLGADVALVFYAGHAGPDGGFRSAPGGAGSLSAYFSARHGGGALLDLFVAPARVAEIDAASRDWPSHDLAPRQLCDLQLLLNGGFSPLTGFMTSRDHAAVCSDMRLADGTLWPIPITLDVGEPLADELSPGDCLALRDPEGVMLAVLHVEDIWQPDREAEAEAVCGTANREHPGVAWSRSDPATGRGHESSLKTRQGNPGRTVVDPVGPSRSTLHMGDNNPDRVTRGGDWFAPPDWLRVGGAQLFHDGDGSRRPVTVFTPVNGVRPALAAATAGGAPEPLFCLEDGWWRTHGLPSHPDSSAPAAAVATTRGVWSTGARATRALGSCDESRRGRCPRAGPPAAGSAGTW